MNEEIDNDSEDEEEPYSKSDASASDLSNTYVPETPSHDSSHSGPDLDLTPRQLDSAEEQAVPTKIGRYAIERILGSGGYGCVYLARDTQLERSVALKVPHQHRLDSSDAVDAFLEEARTLASLDHPTVVPIYDFDRWKDGCYVVSKYIEGETLSQRQRRSPMTLHQTVRLLHSVASTLNFIHLKGVVHRDVKPSNLLLDEHGGCFITDFGLALREIAFGRDPGQMGTVSYMSPEQARGESHLVDGRSDLFSLGIVMYELLTGARPFTGENWQAITVMICYHEPKPPRQRVSTIPKELERICLKLLAKRANDRYLTASDLAGDLEHFVEKPLATSQSDVSVSRNFTSTSDDISSSTGELVGIIPRGLRSFDREDSFFFRQLLPGPRDRDGFPESVQFWKRRVESNNVEDVFRVGVIYGPSGSGKSSFIKAGLLPTLEDRCTTVFIEATPETTEDRLLNRLRTRCPDIPPVLNLTETLSWVRNSVGGQSRRKLLIVIDQFEQWLNSWNDSPDSELPVALRQCDGESLQVILLVRDDFWLAVSRFAEVLEVDLVPTENLAMIDLFDKRHARKVLAEYGRGHARLPERLADLTKSQNAFLDQAIEGLADGDKVIPVQLAAFSEIMKGRDWDVKSLNQLGGVKGVGVRFLDESFTAAGAPIHHRSHESAAQSILRALLPDAGTNIKGAMQSESELRAVSGYASNEKMFNQLVQILDTELRLITPTDVANEKLYDAEQDTSGSQKYYQLTHDFLVPAVRTWLDRRQQATLAGRTAMRLADRTEVWTARSEKRHLPSWLEWVSFLLLTRASQRDTNQQRLMAAATRRHGVGTLVTMLAVVAVVWAGTEFRRRIQTEKLAALAASFADQLKVADDTEVSGVIDRLAENPELSIGPVNAVLSGEDADSSTKVRALLALLRMVPSNQSLLQQLQEHLFSVNFELLPVIRDELLRSSEAVELAQQLWLITKSAEDNSSDQFRAAMLLAAFDPPVNIAAKERWAPIAGRTAEQLVLGVTKTPQYYNTMANSFLPATAAVLPRLRQIYSSKDADLSDRRIATNLLSTLLKNDSAQLTDVFLDADNRQLETFLKQLDASFSEIRPLLLKAIAASPNVDHDEEAQEYISNRRANAAAMLLRHRDEHPVWTLLAKDVIPNTRTEMIERMAQLSVPADLPFAQLKNNPEADVAAAILLALGSYDVTSWTPDLKEEVRVVARKLYQTHPAADVHSSAEWLLGRLGDNEWATTIRETLVDEAYSGDRLWRINSQGQTLVRIPLDGYTIEFGTTEVTKSQFKQFMPTHQQKLEKSPYGSCPACMLTWIDAVKYCRWLTVTTGMTEDDQCFPDPDQTDNDIRVYEDFDKRSGYRLPTAYEWERACFDNVITTLPYGTKKELVLEYGWLHYNAGDRLHRVGKKKPGPFGLFDMAGNVSEWCAGGEFTAKSSTARASRGAGYNALFNEVGARSYMGQFEMNTRFYSVGLRIARTITN